MKISIIIPVLSEQAQINGVINHLRSLDQTLEIIVADGDPSGSTIMVIADQKVITLTASKGRGNQLAAAVKDATGDILLLLHADTLLPDNALQVIAAAIASGADWGAFRLGINAPGYSYRLIEQMVDLRCKLFTLPYGDQAIFITRDALNTIGGIPAIPLMEDVELARRLYKAGYPFTLLQDRVATSPRRWQQDGIIRRTLGNWLLLTRYLAGADSRKLAKLYRTD